MRQSGSSAERYGGEKAGLKTHRRQQKGRRVNKGFEEERKKKSAKEIMISVAVLATNGAFTSD